MMIYRMVMGCLQLCCCVCRGTGQSKKNTSHSAEELLTAGALDSCLTPPGPMKQPSLAQAMCPTIQNRENSTLNSDTLMRCLYLSTGQVHLQQLLQTSYDNNCNFNCNFYHSQTITLKSSNNIDCCFINQCLHTSAGTELPVYEL